MYEVTTEVGNYVAWFVIIFVVVYTILYAVHPEALRIRGSHKLLPWSTFVTALIITLVLLLIVWLASFIP